MNFRNISNFINSIFNGKTMDMGYQNNKAIDYNDILNYQSIASLLPYRLYDEINDVYVNDNSYGFIIELCPLVGGDEQTVNLLTQLITDGLPENCFLSFFNWASPNIESTLELWSKPREKVGDLYKKQALERKKFLMEGVKKSLFEDKPFTLKNFRTFMTATMPFSAKGDEDNIKTLRRLLAFRTTLRGTLKNIGIYSDNVPKFTPDYFINFLRELLNPISGDAYDYIRYDKLNPINTQIADAENTLLVLKDRLVFEKNNTVVKTLSVKSYPRQWAEWQCSELIGSLNNEQLKMSCPFLTCFSFVIENEDTRTAKAKLKQTRVTQQCGTNLAKFMPRLFKQKEEWDFVVDKLESGQKLATASYSVILFDKEDRIEESERTLKSIYRNNGWLLQTDRYIHLGNFLSALYWVMV